MEFDNKFIESCRNGDRNAQFQLFNKLSPSMLGVCFRYCNSEDEANDVMQDGFIKVFTNIDSYRGDGSFEGWVKRIMINTALNNYNKNKKLTTHRNIEDIRETDILDDDYEIPKSRFTQAEMLDAISQLPEGYKMIFNLYAIEEYKHREIADMLNISVNTSKSQLSKARTYLKRLLNKIEINKSGNYFDDDDE